MTAEDVVVVMVTVGSAPDAERIGHALVEERLAACVNVVGPIRSIYRWRDVVEEASEHLLLVKGRAADLGAIEDRVRALHSYEVPEVLALPVRAGSTDYLTWLGSATDRR
jgi:periplasmic divalent cation tolerance protein